MQRHPSLDFERYDEFDDSEGETSDDLCSTSQSFKSNSNADDNENNFIDLSSLFDGIEKIYIHSKVIDSLPEFRDADFNLESLRKEVIVRQKTRTDKTECLVTCIPHPNSFPRLESEYSLSSPYIIGWSDIRSLPPTDFGNQTNSYIKKGYQKVREQLRFLQLINPSPEKFDSLSSIRRDVPVGRTVFHYIGSPKNITDGKNIFLNESRTQELHPYPVKLIFSNVNVPSGFVFDCDNAGSILPTLEKQAKRLKKALSTTFPNNAGLVTKIPSCDDWFAFFLTSEKEYLPYCQNLPRDFLTSCFLSPVETSILCHIITYYQTSFPVSMTTSSNSQPTSLSLINIIRSKDCAPLFQSLNAICEAILADYLSVDLMDEMLRSDQVYAQYTKFFILAQFLLMPYNIHPISKPALPIMVNHPLWSQWQSTLDLWVATNMAPNFKDNIFSQAVNSFKVNQNVSGSLLSLVSNVPFTDTDEFDQIFPILANFCKQSEVNCQLFSRTALFTVYFKKFLNFDPHSTYFDSICYLILCFITCSPSLVFTINKEHDLTSLCRLIFDNSINYTTHACLCSIISLIIPATRMIRLVLCSYDYLNDLMKIMNETNSCSLMWNLLLLRRIFEFSLYELPQMDFTGFALRSVMALFHSSHQVRAAAMSSMICFVQTSDIKLNYILLAFSLAQISDMSFHVRHFLLCLVGKYIVNDMPSFLENLAKKSGVTSTHETFSELVSFWLGEKVDMSGNFSFDVLIEVIQKILSKDGLKAHFDNIVFLIVDYLSKDPHPNIKQSARKMKYFLTHKTKAEPLPNSSDSLRDFTEDSESDLDGANIFDYDSEALFNSATRQILANNENNNKTSFIQRNKNKAEALTIKTGSDCNNVSCCCLKPLKINLNSRIQKIVFNNQAGMDIVATTANKHVYFLDDNLNIKRDLLMYEEISDIRFSNDNVLISTSDGCCSLWSPKIFSASLCTFRSDPNYLCELVPQFAAFSDQSHVVASRGNSGLSLWDLQEQKLVGEFTFSMNHIVSALAVNPKSPNICIAGFHDGSLIAFDLRQKSDIFNINLNSESIISVVDDGNNVLAATVSGGCFVWDYQKVDLNRCGAKRGKLADFDVNSGMIAFTPIDSHPIITDRGNTNVISIIKDINDITTTALSRGKRPLAACGTRSGDLHVLPIDNI